MARTNFAIYNADCKVESYYVENNLDQFDRTKFSCCFCGVKIEYNIGTLNTGPYFKNWRKIDHNKDCLLTQSVQLYLDTKQEKDYKLRDAEELILSTILPRAQRLFNADKKSSGFKRVSTHLQSKRTRSFMTAINQLEAKDFDYLNVVTEDNEILKLKDLILPQDVIIDQLQKGQQTSCIRILKGTVSRVIPVGNNYKVIMTKGEKYQNSKDFYLFVPHSYVEKNEKRLKDLRGALIYCYGIAEKNEYGCKMDLYSIYHQIVILEKFE